MAEPELQRLRSNPELPEENIMEIISRLNPKEWCRGCVVSQKFREGSESDENWDRFLPPDWLAILSRSSAHLHFTSLKQLYLDLSDNPILIDCDTKSFFLDKWSGKKCYLLAACDLCIIWGGTLQYWRWISLPESSFPEVAELNYVWWFDIRGKMSTSMLSPKTNYAAYLVFKLRKRASGFNPPPKASVGTTGGVEDHKQTICLGPATAREQRLRQQHQIVLLQQHTSHSKLRKDRWLEIELGEFFNEGGEDELQIRLMEVEAGTGKTGLIVEGI